VPIAFSQFDLNYPVELLSEEDASTLNVGRISHQQLTKVVERVCSSMRAKELPIELYQFLLRDPHNIDCFRLLIAIDGVIIELSDPNAGHLHPYLVSAEFTITAYGQPVGTQIDEMTEFGDPLGPRALNGRNIERFLFNIWQQRMLDLRGFADADNSAS